MSDFLTVEDVMRRVVPLSWTEELSQYRQKFLSGNPSDIERVMFADPEVGKALIIPHIVDGTANFIEMVVGFNNDDSITTYCAHDSIFIDPKHWAMARKILIQDICESLKALPSTVSLFDEGRQREVFLAEMGICQLQDVAKTAKEYGLKYSANGFSGNNIQSVN